MVVGYKWHTFLLVCLQGIVIYLSAVNLLLILKYALKIYKSNSLLEETKHTSEHDDLFSFFLGSVSPYNQRSTSVPFTSCPERKEKKRI